MDRSESSPHPYHALPEYQFWNRSISAVEAHLVDPVTRPRFTISKEARVATAGSCFAQHISRSISRSGFNYLVTETAPDMPTDEASASSYGVFSARYGNIYTTVQLLQLFDEAFGTRCPDIEPWQRPDGRFIDPVRQQVEPQGFGTSMAAKQDRARHLACVKRMFLEADIFVFTLGLTEAWRFRTDGTVVSSAPGVVGGQFDPAVHEFVNFSVEETYCALEEFLVKFRKVNPAAKVLLTVSPVPLIATYEDRSVLLSTTYSKSVLRVAAEKAISSFDWVDYFPSYEIITGSFSGGLYYEQNQRDVNSLGVAHAIRCFMQNYADAASDPRPLMPRPDHDYALSKSVMCDEEMLDMARG